MRMGHSLLVKALALVMAVFLALFACLFALLYHSSLTTLHERELNNVATRLEMVCAYLDLALANARNTSYQFMQSGLMDSADDGAVQAFFQGYSETGSVVSVKFLLEGERVVAIDKPLLLTSLTVDSAFFYGQAQHNRLVLSGPYYSPLAAGRVVALIRSIPGRDGGAERLLVMELRTANLLEKMAEKLSRQEAVVLLTPAGETVYMNFYASILGQLVPQSGQLELGGGLREQLLAMDTGAREITLGEQAILAQCARYSPQWNVYYLIGAERFYEKINEAARRFLFLGVAGALVLLIGEALVILGVMRPMKRLARQVDALPVDESQALLPVNRRDEIGSLAASFNSLLTRLRAADAEKVEMERRRFLLEYKVLQSQIQPHFLFNTLLCVSSFLERGKSEEALCLLGDLDALLRASTDQYGESWTLGDETALLKRYVDIQRTRYGESFDVDMGDCSPWEAYPLPKLLLQPIVENAIYHGLASVRRHGEIRIRFVALEEDMLDITIEDNGGGMSPERLRRVLDEGGQEEKSRGMVSIGLANVRQRIRQFYGPACGLYVRSREGIGTAVELVICRAPGREAASGPS